MNRSVLLNEIDSLIKGNCHGCTQIKTSGHRDIVAADREICAACPVGARLLELGILLDEQIRQSREGKDIPFIYEEPDKPKSKIMRPDRKPGPTPELTREVFERCLRDGMMQKEIAVIFGVNIDSMKYWARKWSVVQTV